MALEYESYQNSSLLNSEQMDGCLVCFETSAELVSLPCGCEFCESCLVTWMECQISELQFQQNGSVECLSQSCKKRFDPSSILDMLHSAEREKIDNLLLRTYLKKTTDIRHCPNSNCSYAGVIGIKEKCRKSLECELCKNKWRDRIHFGFAEELLFKLSKLRVSEFISNLWEEIFTNRCPVCSISIIRNGGCPHMTCKKCGYEFCWFCLHEHKSHKPEVCFCTVLSKVTILALMILSILNLTGVLNVVQTGTWTFFKLLVKIAVYDLGIVLTGTLCNLIRETSVIRYKTTRNCQMGCFCFMLVLLVGIYGFGLWYFELLYHAMYCTLGQFGVVALALFHDTFFSNWLRRVY